MRVPAECVADLGCERKHKPCSKYKPNYIKQCAARIETTLVVWLVLGVEGACHAANSKQDCSEQSPVGNKKSPTVSICSVLSRYRLSTRLACHASSFTSQKRATFVGLGERTCKRCTYPPLDDHIILYKKSEIAIAIAQSTSPQSRAGLQLDLYPQLR